MMTLKIFWNTIIKGITLALFAFLPFCLSQSVEATRLANETYFSLKDVAELLNYNTSVTQNSFTLRRGDGVLVVFANDPDLLWTPQNASTETIALASPILKREDNWFAPTELLSFFSITLNNNVLILPNNQRASLYFPRTAPQSQASQNISSISLPNGDIALVFYSSGEIGSDSLSLMIMDLGALSIASQYQGNLKKSKPLYFVLTALAESNWQSEIIFRQGNNVFAARYPLNIIILEGEATKVGPEKPVSGVVTLPESFDLRSNINVQWSGINTDFRFQR